MPKITPTPVEHQLVSDDEGKRWYIIPAGELKTFYRWLDAKAGKRRIPNHFVPILVRGPESIVFERWRELER